jgi:hypothetical protein
MSLAPITNAQDEFSGDDSFNIFPLIQNSGLEETSITGNSYFDDPLPSAHYLGNDNDHRHPRHREECL